MSKNRKKQKKKKRRLILPIIFIVLLILIIGVFFGGNYYLEKKTGSSLKEFMSNAKEIVDASDKNIFMPNNTSYIYSNDGTELISLNEDVEQSYLSYDEIPENVINAFIAVEDRTFWENNGIDMKGILRVCLNYIRTRGKVAQGASTITQQLARTIFLTQDKNITRKINEIFISLELTKKYSKEEIMEFYVNNCCFANGIYGIEDASLKYFDKPASELTLSEAAYLCAIPNRPEYYNPYNDPNNAIKRRDKILDDMAECGFISESECLEAKDAFVTVKKKVEEYHFYNYETTYAMQCAEEYLMSLSGFEFQSHFDTAAEYEEYQTLYAEAMAQAEHELKTGGYTITTSIDLDAQSKLQDILNEELSFNSDADSSGIYNLQGAITVIDNETGKVIAAIGGREQEETEGVRGLNRVFQTQRQPGSCIKPIAVYAPALDSGDYTPTSRLKDIDVQKAYEEPDKIDSMWGTSYRLRNAVEKSRNGCAIFLFSALKPSFGLSYLEEMEFSHIVKENDYNLSSALGGLTYGTNTEEMANAYYTLVNHGVYQKADCIVSILDIDGNEIYEPADEKQVYDTAAADAMVDILKGVITDGTASKMNWYSNTDTEAAGKTGTTNGEENQNNSKDGWFCGFTPYYTISVWVGNDDNTIVNGLSGSSYPASIWQRCMKYLIQFKPTAAFELDDTLINSKPVYTYEPKEEKEEETEKENEEKEQDPDTPDPANPDQTTTEPGTDTTVPGTADPGTTEPDTPATPNEPDTPDPTPSEPDTPDPTPSEPDTPDQSAQDPAAASET